MLPLMVREGTNTRGSRVLNTLPKGAQVEKAKFLVKLSTFSQHIGYKIKELAVIVKKSCGQGIRSVV